jgi:hypothetical protein
MTMPTLETILSRAMSEPDFARQLFLDADQALREYDLTAEERTQIKSVSHATFDSMTLEERRSFASLMTTTYGRGSFQIR